MINVEIKNGNKTIQEKINDWKELEQLVLKYKNYTSFKATDMERKEKENEKRPTR